MKKLILSLFLVSCENKHGTKLEDVRREAKQAVDTTADYVKEGANETRDDAVKASESQLAAIDAKMTALKADISKRNDAAKVQAQKSIDELAAKRDEVAKNLDQLKKDGESTWKETRRKVSAVVNAFEASASDLKARLDKI